MIRSTKSGKVLALLLGASLLAAACGDDDDEGGGGADTTAAAADTTAGGETTAEESADTTEAEEEAAAGEGGTITVAYEQEFSAYNNNTSAENSVENTIVLNQITPRAFIFTGDAEVVLNEEMMVSAELVSESPQVVEYVVKPEAVWSDGEPIDCDDWVMHWVALKEEFKQKNPDGTVATDPTTGAELNLFDAGQPGFPNIASTECSPDGKTITQTYSEPFPDWQQQYIDFLPAHIVEQQSGVADFVAAYEAKDEAQMTAAAEFWSTGWVFNPGEIPEELTPSAGPFKFGTWEPGSSVTLLPNENYYGTPPKASEIVIRFIPQDAAVQALQNQEVQVISPQPNNELVAQLEGLPGVEVNLGQDYTYEHLDFNFNVPAFQDPNVREAFALCVPRQAIVDNLVKPQNPEIEVMNNRWIYPFEDAYEDNSGGQYLEPDIARSAELLEQAGQTGLTVRIGYRTPNQRRTDTVALIKATCDQAGFVIQDAGTETFFGVELDQGDFDVALYGWAGTPLKTATGTTFNTGGSNNNGNYSNPEVDALNEQLLTSTSQDEVLELANQMDVILWEDLATIPLFAFPAITAWSETVDGVVYNPTQYEITWNTQEWAAA